MNRTYLLVTHIPFTRKDGQIIVDQLWANDLKELTSHIGPIRLAAPELSVEESSTWGPKTVALSPSIPITFVGLPPMRHSWDLWTKWKIQSILKKEVEQADLVHTSNLFNPYLGLLYAHFLAARLNKKTLFVVAEDYHDTLIWEWVRFAKSTWQWLRRNLLIKRMDYLTQKAVSVASLTLFFTPAALLRFRLYTANGIAVRDTTHSINDIVSEELFNRKCREISEGVPLKLVAACRHKPLKGVDMAIRAIAILKQRGIVVEANLYGHGPLTSDYQKLATELNIDDCVHFPGALDAQHEIFGTLAAHHISLMPHRTNEFARALYDAFAGGTPVVAFSTAASEGAVREGVDGLLTPLDNPMAMANAIERLHHERDFLVTLSKNARARAFRETRTIWHKFRADLTEELFKEDATR